MDLFMARRWRPQRARIVRKATLDHAQAQSSTVQQIVDRTNQVSSLTRERTYSASTAVNLVTLVKSARSHRSNEPRTRHLLLGRLVAWVVTRESRGSRSARL